MRLVNHLKELMDGLGWTEKQLSQAVGFDQRTIKALLRNTEWRLDRDMYRRLAIFAHDHNYPKGLFELQPHPLWDTFLDHSATIYRGDQHFDAKVETHFRDFFQHHNVSFKLALSARDQAAIENAIETKNCLFIGSPKTNPATEIALAKMFDGTPFETAAVTRKPMPACFLGPAMGDNKSALMTASQRTGVRFAMPNKRPVMIPVDWVPPDEYQSFAGEGQDAALVVVRRVGQATTVVVAGYTGLATKVAAEGLTHGEPAIYDAALTNTDPQLAAVYFRYRKRKGGRGQSLANLRHEIPGSTVWAPPWKNAGRRILPNE